MHGLNGGQSYLVKLLLSEIIVVMHGLNEGVESVDCRVSDTFVVSLQRLHHFDAHLLAKSEKEPGKLSNGLEDGMTVNKMTIKMDMDMDMGDDKATMAMDKTTKSM